VRQGRSGSGGTRTAAVPILILLAMAGPAAAAAPAALSPGVHVDPNSPAAKEYAIPLQRARGASPPTTGGSSSGGSGSSNGLFGSGIIPAKTKVSTPTARTPGGAHSVSKGSAPHRGSTPVAPPPAVPVMLAAHARGSGSGIGWMLGAGVLVLFLGGLGAIVLARVVRRRAGASLS
jgi:hypothetical protein